jgi:hypothetical protein
MQPVVVANLIAACSTIGREFDQRRVDDLAPGISNMRDAIDSLGSPATRSSMPNGRVLLQWHYARGTLVGYSAHVAILFDAQGVMMRVAHRAHSRI